MAVFTVQTLDVTSELMKRGYQEQISHVTPPIPPSPHDIQVPDIPVIPDEIRVEVARRYIQAYELITNEEFVPEDISPGEEKKRVLAALS